MSYPLKNSFVSDVQLTNKLLSPVFLTPCRTFAFFQTCHSEDWKNLAMPSSAPYCRSYLRYRAVVHYQNVSMVSCISVVECVVFLEVFVSMQNDVMIKVPCWHSFIIFETLFGIERLGFVVASLLLRHALAFFQKFCCTVYRDDAISN